MMTGRRTKLGAGILLFLGGFAVALGAAWWWFGQSSRPQPVETATLGETDLGDMFAAVQAGDYPAIKRLGEALFAPGTRVMDSERLLSAYAVNSVPPYTVYALHTYNDAERTRRVLLTLDESGRVESFLAEEMAVIK